MFRAGVWDAKLSRGPQQSHRRWWPRCSTQLAHFLTLRLLLMLQAERAKAAAQPYVEGAQEVAADTAAAAKGTGEVRCCKLMVRWYVEQACQVERGAHEAQECSSARLDQLGLRVSLGVVVRCAPACISLSMPSPLPFTGHRSAGPRHRRRAERDSRHQ